MIDWSVIGEPATVVVAAVAVLGLLHKLVGERKRIRKLEEQVRYLKRALKQLRSERPLFPTTTSKATGKITKVNGISVEPGKRLPVDRVFSVEGWCQGPPGCHFWLAVQVYSLYWPKRPQLELDEVGHWRQDEVREGGWPADRKFELDLLEVSTLATENFEGWFREATFEGLSIERLGPGANLLDSVKLRLNESAL